MSEVLRRMGRELSWRYPWGKAKGMQTEDREGSHCERKMGHKFCFWDYARERANHVSCAEAATI